MLTGGVFGLLLAALVITYRVDQIIAGVVINLFVLGLTSYVSSQVFAEFRWLNKASPFRAFKIPVLGDIPLIGPVLFNQNLFVYGALVLVTLSTYDRFHTRHGLRARAVGEHPRAADTLASMSSDPPRMSLLPAWWPALAPGSRWLGRVV